MPTCLHLSVAAFVQQWLAGGGGGEIWQRLLCGPLSRPFIQNCADLNVEDTDCSLWPGGERPHAKDNRAGWVLHKNTVAILDYPPPNRVNAAPSWCHGAILGPILPVSGPWAECICGFLWPHLYVSILVPTWRYVYLFLRWYVFQMFVKIYFV